MKQHPVFQNYFGDELGNIYNSSGKKLRTRVDRYGYEKLTLWKNRKSFNITVHRFIYTCFHGIITNEQTIDHIDGNKLNNTLKNLRVLSLTDNVREAYRNGQNKSYGVYNPNNKLTEIEVLEIRKLHSARVPIKEIAELYNVSYGCVAKAARKETWKHL